MVKGYMNAGAKADFKLVIEGDHTAFPNWDL
jgi:hypothetical protein